MEPVFLELFSGSAGVTAAFKRRGWSSCVAVDKTILKHTNAHVIHLDLTRRDHQKLVHSWIEQPEVEGVFMAPPCGTCSLARSIPIPGEDNAPCPLRSLFEPDGFSFLESRDADRVGQANILYQFVADTAELCERLNKLCMIENPANSLFWHVTSIAESKAIEKFFFQDHQACAYGSSRPKWTRLAANFAQVHSISQVCPQDHFHESWGLVKKGNKRVFATALEVHYPKGLCEAIASAFELKLLQDGWKPSERVLTNAHAAASTGVQPTKAKIAPLVPEFKAKISVLLTQAGDTCWPPVPVDLTEPKLLHKLPVGGKCDEEVFQNIANVKSALHVDVDIPLDKQVSKAKFFAVYGVYWEPEEFVSKALDIDHPLSSGLIVPEILRNEIKFQANAAPYEVVKKRLKFVAKWTARAKSLVKEESVFKSKLDPLVAKVVANKRLLLFQEILKETGFPDPDVIDELKCGASLTGNVPLTGMLPQKFVPPMLEASSLSNQAKLLRQGKLDHACSSGVREIDLEVWKKTLEEVELSWLEGPFELADIPLTSPITRRFGLKQKHKVRLIDDFTQSGINHYVTVHETPSLHTVDIAASVIVEWLGLCSTLKVSPQLQIKTFDLSSAYKQIALNEAGRQFATISVWDPFEQRPRYFRSTVLPFGAVRSVHSFLRVARSLWWIGTVGCSLLWTSFYDDFLLLSKPELAKSADQAAVALFKLTGWLFAEDGRKSVSFGSCCDALGVSFDLKESPLHKSYIKNTETRKTELAADLKQIVDQNVLSAKQAQRIRGRMQFADSQLFGRTSKRCLSVLSDFAVGLRYKLGSKDIFFIELFVSFLMTGVPRLLLPGNQGNILIFTDACYEREASGWICGIGGVMFDPQNKCSRFFSFELDENLRKCLGEQQKQQIIFEAETLAAVAAILLWKEYLGNRRCIVFVDNEGTKFSMLKARSDNFVVDKLVELFATFESTSQVITWIDRVASKSNIADKPSRGDIEELIASKSHNDTDVLIPIVQDICTKF